MKMTNKEPDVSAILKSCEKELKKIVAEEKKNGPDFDEIEASCRKAVNNMVVRIKSDEGYGLVDRKRYIHAKWQQMVEFGYTTLTEKTVEEQLDAVLAGKVFGTGLTVIGGFIKQEVVVE
jgi:hypothetical protein